MAAHDTTTSNVPSSNGSLRMSAALTSTRSPTPPPPPPPLRILDRRLGAIPREVLRLPDVHPHCLPRREPLRRADEHEPPPAPDVEHALVAAPRDVVEHPLPIANLPNLAVPQHPDGHDSAADRRKQRHVPQRQPHRSEERRVGKECRSR